MLFTGITDRQHLEIQPVSYTHLDVYKRQVLKRVRLRGFVTRLSPQPGNNFSKFVMLAAYERARSLLFGSQRIAVGQLKAQHLSLIHI